MRRCEEIRWDEKVWRCEDVKMMRRWYLKMRWEDEMKRYKGEKIGIY